MTMSSFRLKTYFTRSLQHSVSILTNIVAFFLQHLHKIRMIRSPVKHKHTKHNNKFIVISRRYMFPGSRQFQTKQYKTLTLSLWINIRSLSTCSTKQWMNERPPKLVLRPDPAILKNISWNKRRRKNLAGSGVWSSTLRSGKQKKQRY